MRVGPGPYLMPGEIAGLVAELVVLAAGAAQAQTQDAGGACRRVKVVRGEVSRSLARGTTVGVTAAQQVRLRRPRTRCPPAVAVGRTVPPLASGLQSWEVEVDRDDARGGRYGETLALETSLGKVAGRLQALTHLLAPVGVALGAGGTEAAPSTGPFSCRRRHLGRRSPLRAEKRGRSGRRDLPGRTGGSVRYVG